MNHFTAITGWVSSEVSLADKTSFREFIHTWPESFPEMRKGKQVWISPDPTRSNIGHPWDMSCWTWFDPERDGEDVLLEKLALAQRGFQE